MVNFSTVFLSLALKPSSCFGNGNSESKHALETNTLERNKQKQRKIRTFIEDN